MIVDSSVESVKVKYAKRKETPVVIPKEWILTSSENGN